MSVLYSVEEIKKRIAKDKNAVVFDPKTSTDADYERILRDAVAMRRSIDAGREVEGEYTFLSENYPRVYKAVKSKCDMGILEGMLRRLIRVKRGESSLEKEENDLGKEMSDRFVKKN